jgi:diacylglycerol O-acyltransferase / wax synthase
MGHSVRGMHETEERLTSLDATFLELEQVDEGALMHIGGALLFEPDESGRTPTPEQLCELLDDRVPLLPRFRRRLSEPRVHGLRRPAWVQDEAYDNGAHIRHATLPSPGTDADLHEWLADFWSHRLDRARPLWEMTLVDGLADGGWMLATKTHHAMVDGVGSVDIGHILLDAERHPKRRPLAGDGSANGHISSANGGSGSTNGVVSTNDASHNGGLHLPGMSQAAAAARLARSAGGVVRHPDRLLHAGEAAAAMGELLWKDEVMGARSSSLNVPIGTTRRFSSVVFDLDEVKAVKRELGGTVNDVVLAVAAGGLRALLHERGEALDSPLRAMVPVNLRADDDSDMGNRVTSLFVELPIGEALLRARYERTREAAMELKSGTAALGGSTLVLATGMAPPVLHESISKMLFAPRLFNLTITNVPGPQLPLYSLGCRMRRILPLVPLFADHAVGMAIVSYDGELVFGINADFTAVPDLELLRAAMADEFDQLKALANV